ncbi:MAG TPA: hypothetical protein VL334_03475 [Anaerolineae bacterium]|nr:hypothetical protein [Anaerolineae bacterium]
MIDHPRPIEVAFPLKQASEERKALLERLAGRVVTKSKRVKTAGGGYKEQFVEETEGGIIHR